MNQESFVTMMGREAQVNGQGNEGQKDTGFLKISNYYYPPSFQSPPKIGSFHFLYHQPKAWVS